MESLPLPPVLRHLLLELPLLQAELPLLRMDHPLRLVELLQQQQSLILPVSRLTLSKFRRDSVLAPSGLRAQSETVVSTRGPGQPSLILERAPLGSNTNYSAD